MDIELKELRQVISDLLNNLEYKRGSKIILDNDFYWCIDQEQLFDTYETPKKFSIGQLSDDWTTLKSSAKSKNLIPYDLQRISIILKALSVENPI